MSYLGLDVAAASRLADLLAQWPARVDDVQHTLTLAESLSELDAGLYGQLVDISTSGRAMAVAIRRAVDVATTFRIDPRLGFFVDRPVGSPYEPAIADQALNGGETYRQVEIGQEIAALGAELSNVPPGRREQISQQIAALRAEYEAIDPATSGDAGGSLTAEVRTPFSPLGTSALALGAGIIAHALSDTADDDEIHLDEFQAIFHDNGKVTLVLPGVIDLSKPDYGLDEVHRSARDIDQHALPSSFDSSIDSNVYAQLIVEWLETQVANGVILPGTDVMIVGHSFGADTALDLASDPYVNGELINITHVIPAAYHSEPQLNDVVNGTQVGVLQNIYDLPVLGEGIGGDLTGLATGLVGTLTGSSDEPMGGEGSGAAALSRPLVELGEEVLSFGPQAFNAVGQAVNTLQGNPARPVPATTIAPGVPTLPTDIEILGNTVHVLADQGFVAEFEGGFEGLGHHQNNYIDYVESDELPPVVTNMFVEIGEAGYGEPGVSLAIDISVPGGTVPPPEPPRVTPPPLDLLPDVELVNPLEPLIPPLQPVLEPLAPVVTPLAEPFEALIPEPGD